MNVQFPVPYCAFVSFYNKSKTENSINGADSGNNNELAMYGCIVATTATITTTTAPVERTNASLHDTCFSIPFFYFGMFFQMFVFFSMCA